MGKSKDLSPSLKQRIITSFQSGIKQSEIARTLRLNRCTVCAVIKRYRERGSVENKPRTGRKKKLSVQDERSILRSVKLHRVEPLKEITQRFNQFRENPVSEVTVKRCLFRNNYHRRVVRKNIRIREVNIKKRVAWARGKRHWKVDGDWNRVIFSDECKVIIGENNRVYVWRRPGEEWMPQCISPGRGARVSLMIWGCICWNGPGTLTVVNGNINAEKYREILDNELWPDVARHFPQNDFIFQDDNAPVHRARSVLNYKTENNIRGILWPAQSPDANIIENCWLLLKNQLRKCTNRINNAADLEREIRRIWTTIPIHYIQNLYKSLPQTIIKIIRSKGYATKY